MKPQSWYSQTGEASTTPAIRDTFNASVNGVSRPLIVICAHVCVLSPAFCSSSNVEAQPTESSTGLVMMLTMSL